MALKKIELNSEQRDLLRYVLDNMDEENLDGIINGDYTPSGIRKAVNAISNSAQIKEKLLYEILI